MNVPARDRRGSEAKARICLSISSARRLRAGIDSGIALSSSTCRFSRSIGIGRRNTRIRGKAAAMNVSAAIHI